MKIIKEGCIKYTPYIYRGECDCCGCIFETTLEIAYRKDGRRIIKNNFELKNLGICGIGYIQCQCPSCKDETVTLYRPDSE